MKFTYNGRLAGHRLITLIDKPAAAKRSIWFKSNVRKLTKTKLTFKGDKEMPSIDSLRVPTEPVLTHEEIQGLAGSRYQFQLELERLKSKAEEANKNPILESQMPRISRETESASQNAKSVGDNLRDIARSVTRD